MLSFEEDAKKMMAAESAKRSAGAIVNSKPAE